MRIIKRATTDDGHDVSLALDEGTNWQNFVLKGLPAQHSGHENRAQSLAAAVSIWNRVVPSKDKLSIQEVSASLRSGGKIH